MQIILSTTEHFDLHRLYMKKQHHWIVKQGCLLNALAVPERIGFKIYLLLWKRAQQKAPNVPMRTMRARNAPTATPMMTANRRDSEKTWRKDIGTVAILGVLMRLRLSWYRHRTEVVSSCSWTRVGLHHVIFTKANTYCMLNCVLANAKVNTTGEWQIVKTFYSTIYSTDTWHPLCTFTSNGWEVYHFITSDVLNVVNTFIGFRGWLVEGSCLKDQCISLWLVKI